MTRTIQRNGWELALPDGWVFQEDDSCDTITGPDSIGALQISSAVKDSLVADDDLRSFAQEHIDAGAKLRDVECGDFCGFSLCFSDADTHWQLWYLRRARRMLFVTYNCHSEDRNVENEDVQRILAALRARTSP